ncbi:hypothetical protein [Sphingomonas sp. IBVSS2]|uniref:hypothetical protein n=1 Tax=Sphingomonas sp. IBVSS2 TaxID=1985172 RepID=UPI001181C1E1|nr:hypothetical protein [Sphingomonas sp. IBVSS2]
MMTPPLSDDEYVNRLYDDIREELVGIFSHSPARASEILASFYTKHPECDEDFYFHQGPFNMALRVHYEQVLGGEASSADFVAWRKNYDSIWNERMK